MFSRPASLFSGLLAACSLALVAPQAGAEAAPAPQYPFACTAQDYGLALIVDNHAGDGVAVRDAEGRNIGYSRDCEAETRFWYYAVDEQGHRHRVRDHDQAAPGGEGLADVQALVGGTPIAMLTLTDGREVPYLIRHERGVIKRFIYSISMLVPADEVLHGDPEAPDHAHWNGRLLYQFQGGVGIGHTQGRYSSRAITGRPDRLARGYAVVHSSGNRTGDHYNMLRAGRVAERVKARFVERHGEPLYTVGLGGSGGAVQQYLIAQNHPGLLDAAVPQRSYPDMATQVIHISDCALLDRTMNRDVDDPAFWRSWDRRQWLQGLNAIDGYLGRNAERMTRISRIVRLLGIDYPAPTGSSECMESWLGLLPLAFNPHFGNEANWELLGRQQDAIERTHFSDAREAYGTDPETGYARVPWDNVGVQYGLRALRDGRISPEQFLDINHHVGGWKPPELMRPEVLPFTYPNDLLRTLAEDRDWPLWRTLLALFAGGLRFEEVFDPYSGRNAWQAEGPDRPAARTRADPDAVAAITESGMVFSGHLPRQIPIIDVRDYLEPVLDMHHARQSFVARARLLAGQGQAEMHRIWFVDSNSDGVAPAIEEVSHRALDAIGQWLDPDSGEPGQAPPADADDACFEPDGSLIAAGPEVWAGILDDQPPGSCSERFELFSNSRLEAGAPFTDDVFQCELQSLDAAIERGLYGDWVPDEDQRARLEAIFPRGVCDY
ncbi:MAG: hypothetical protein EA419_09910 [Wenzhouxiangella sp.]|nr:MAG: hypothetical protein EA419_09910 [Wenzhouxiangella sp.]